MQNKINWFGIAGGVCTLMLIVVSVFVPWWQLTVGSGLIQANWSPLNTNFSLVGKAFAVPLLVALNISSMLLLIASCIVMLIYSLYPRKPYAKTLLGFAYGKPLYALILFIIGLVAIVLLPKMLADVNLPWSGSINMVLPVSMTQGVLTSIPVSAYFQWPFALAIVSVIFCIAARVYHKKIIPTSENSQDPTTNVTTTTESTVNSPTP